MGQLKVSVGPGKPNIKSDVLLVQKLLNESQIGVQKEPLKLDGIFGPKMAADILAYQALVVGMPRPDGVVDPGERTIKSLLSGGRDAQRGAGRTATAIGLAKASAESIASKTRPEAVEAFVEMALTAARQVKRDWGVPVAVTLAQSGLTTGWGMHVKDNAYFGIQAKLLTMGSTRLALPEIVDGKRVALRPRTRAYADYAESADSYGRFLSETPRYQSAFRFKDEPVKFAQALSVARGGADPHQGALLTRIIETYGFDEYDKPAGA